MIENKGDKYPINYIGSYYLFFRLSSNMVIISSISSLSLSFTNFKFLYLYKYLQIKKQCTTRTKNIEKTVTLNKPFEGLLITKGIWRELKNFSSGAVCLVVASEVFEETDYIRDFEDFLALSTK